MKDDGTGDFCRAPLWLDRTHQYHESERSGGAKLSTSKRRRLSKILITVPEIRGLDEEDQEGWTMAGEVAVAGAGASVGRERKTPQLLPVPEDVVGEAIGEEEEDRSRSQPWRRSQTAEETAGAGGEEGISPSDNS